MKAENCQKKDETVFHISVLKTNFSKLYHQQGVNLNDPGKKKDFILGKHSNYYQIGNAYLKLK